MTVVKIASNGTITLPAEIREKYKLKPGDSVSVVTSSEGIMIIPVIPLEDLVNSEFKPLANEICHELIKEHRNEREDEK